MGHKRNTKDCSKVTFNNNYRGEIIIIIGDMDEDGFDTLTVTGGNDAAINEMTDDQLRLHIAMLKTLLEYYEDNLKANGKDDNMRNESGL